MSLSSGQRVGPYEIVAPLGAGGMGEVFRARDTRLERDVALKVLPPAFTEDPERLARFEREAKLLASLNHPHVAALHGLEETEGRRVLVMEVAEGEDLKQRLERGPIPVDEAIPIARQVAEALEAAHEKGIVHRDLKPANVKVSEDGTVKVLDFGLAKAWSGEAMSGSGSDLSQSPTLAHSGTAAGVILGTAAYMSPEQARGKSVDKRADIWAFGVLLYETLTGTTLFAGETVSDTLAGVLRQDLDWATLPPETPAAVRRLLRRCLERDPKQRLRDIGDARVELSASLAEADTRPDTTESTTPAMRRAWPWVAGLLVALVAGALVGRFVLQPGIPSPPPVRFEIEVPAVDSAALSPDGSRVVFASNGPLRVRELDRLETRDLEGTDGAIRPFWSPDGLNIGYGADGKIWRVPADGGTPALVCGAPDDTWDQDAGGAWLPDGTIIFSNGGSDLMRVPAAGGDPTVAVAADKEQDLHFHSPSPLPDGQGILFLTHRKDAGRADTLELWADGERKQLLQAEGQSLSSPVYSPTGHILYHRSPTNSGVWALPFSLTDLEARGEPFLVAAGGWDPSASANGTVLYLPGSPTPPGRLSWVDREGAHVGQIGEPREIWPAPALSPDGTRIVVPEKNDGKWDLWLYDLERDTRTRLTSDGSADTSSWAPDGRSLVFDSRPPGGTSVLRRVAADGSGQVEDLGPGRGPSVSKDGAVVLYWSSVGGQADLFYRPLEEGGEPVVLRGEDTPDAWPRLSPDGRLVAYMSFGGPDPQVFLSRFPTGEGRWQVTTEGGWWPHWSADGRSLFFARENDIFEVPVSDGTEVHLGRAQRLFTRPPLSRSGMVGGFEISADGQRFLIVEPESSVAPERSVVVVLNWSPGLGSGE